MGGTIGTEVGTKSPAHVKAQPYTLAGAGLCADLRKLCETW